MIIIEAFPYQIHLGISIQAKLPYALSSIAISHYMNFRLKAWFSKNE